MTAASPGVISLFLANQYYPTHEAYLSALADAMREEYQAIYQAGFLLQLDCPDLAIGMSGADEANVPLLRLHLQALNHAVRDIPPDRLRLHLCWGNYEGPHHRDIPCGPSCPKCWRPARRHSLSRGPTRGTNTSGRSLRRSDYRKGRSSFRAYWTRPRTSSSIPNWSPSASSAM